LKKSEKEQFVADLSERLKRATATFLVDYQGLDVTSINRLRGELRKAETEFQVVKNRLLKIASKDTETGIIRDQMIGPTALAITYDDVVAPAKALVEFAKEFSKIKIKCGQLSGRSVDEDGIKRLSSLPDREVLLAQVLSAMQGVPSAFVRILNGAVAQILNVLEAIRKQKSEES
jgi:large subunit ribosomal protein L10